MTDMRTDDVAPESTANDIQVYGKWTGLDVQISDMSLEVRSMKGINNTFA
jgi:hypothetical protein